MLKRSAEHFAPAVSPVEDKSGCAALAHHAAHGGYPVGQPSSHLLAADDQATQNWALAPSLELENGAHDRLVTRDGADEEGVSRPAQLPKITEREIIPAGVDRFLEPDGELRPQRINLGRICNPDPHTVGLLSGIKSR
ncbi:hypothetical protein [Ensifer adhaerens]|uniref:hypothetical protein n=1 Tax=Ensifer adhaerens TaxID=106592 RepID=UPI00131A0B42|nr:hypothetical protein [Ensifer adhaerens]